MQPLLSVLPPAAFFLLLLLIVGWREAEPLRQRWLTASMGSAVILGLAIALGSELLSAFSLLRFPGVAGLWGVIVIAASAVGLRGHRLARGVERFRGLVRDLRPWSPADKALLGGIAALAATLLAVALAAAPNTSDSLLYHMARITHWLQDGSLRHYAASYHNQLWSPIWTETAILHLMALWGGDRLANLIQWSAMIGSAMAIAGIARQLGASRRGQLLAVVAGVTAPMAVLQATSTQTDFAVGFWVLASVHLLIRLSRQGLRPFGWFMLGGSIGLGMLTKPTFYPYVGLLTAAALVMAWRRGEELRPVLLGGASVALIAVVANAGFWVRNIRTYGTPLGSAEMVSKNASARADPRSLVANTVQHVALNYPTPSEEANRRIIASVRGFSRALGQPAEHFRLIWSWNHEDLAGNPIHAGLIGIAVILALALPDQPHERRWYAGALILSFLAYAWTVESGVYRVRYQLPLILLGAPLVGAMAGRVLSSRLQAGLGFLLFFLSLPWLLFNQTRPVLAWRPRTRTESVFVISRAESLFANAPHAREPFSAAAEAALATGCRRIGLSIDSHDLEYAFWWLLGAPFHGVEVRVVRPLRSLDHLIMTDYDACAVLCTNCEGAVFRGIPLRQAFGDVRLFTPQDG